jgi:hypothetical protein
MKVAGVSRKSSISYCAIGVCDKQHLIQIQSTTIASKASRTRVNRLCKPRLVDRREGIQNTRAPKVFTGRTAGRNRAAGWLGGDSGRSDRKLAGVVHSDWEYGDTVIRVVGENVYGRAKPINVCVSATVFSTARRQWTTKSSIAPTSDAETTIMKSNGPKQYAAWRMLIAVHGRAFSAVGLPRGQ